jgi:phage baseplate assembly protein W
MQHKEIEKMVSGLVFYTNKDLEDRDEEQSKMYRDQGIHFSKTPGQLISENIRRILSTRKGERLNDPNFGSLIKQYLFMPEMMIEDVISEIMNCIRTYEPRAIVNEITFTKSPNEMDTFYINLNVTVRGEDDTFDTSIGIAT